MGYFDEFVPAQEPSKKGYFDEFVPPPQRGRFGTAPPKPQVSVREALGNSRTAPTSMSVPDFLRGAGRFLHTLDTGSTPEETAARPMGPRAFGPVPPPSLGPNIAKDFQAGTSQTKEGIEQIGKAPGALLGLHPITAGKNLLGGGLNTLFGGYGAAYSPVTGAVHSMIGEPVEKASGSKALAGAADFIADAVLPAKLATDFQKSYSGLRALKDHFIPEANPMKVETPVGMIAAGPAAGASARQELGEAARAREVADQTLKDGALVNLTLNPRQQLDVIDAIQTGRVSSLPEDHQQLANTLSNVFQQGWNLLQTTTAGQRAQFRKNYFTESGLFTRPPRPGAPKHFSPAEGYGGFLMHQGQTVKDAIANGAEVKTTDPVAIASNYIANVSKFVAQEHMYDKGKLAGFVKEIPHGTAVPDGWLALAGRKGEYADAFAPAGWAKVYNSVYQAGLEASQIGDVLNGAMRLSNGVKSSVLGLSGYHAVVTTIQEAPASMLAQALGEYKSGQYGRAAQHALMTPIAAITDYRGGRRAGKIYTGQIPGTPEERELVDILTKAGARMTGGRRAAGGLETTTGIGAYKPQFLDRMKAFSRGAEGMDKLLKPAQGALSGVKKIGGEIVEDFRKSNAVVAGFKQFGRIMDTFSAPLFEHYIPAIKNGAAMELLAAYRKANPQASKSELVLAAHKIVDSIDNRFGEMVSDNIFWPKAYKQLAQMAGTSWSYEYGTLRELGGGVQDLLKGHSASFKDPKWSPRMAYNMALPIWTGLLNSVYQKVKTGQMPSEPMDFISPRTGGTNPDGTPERLRPMGYAKEPIRFGEEGPLGWIESKEGTAPQILSNFLTGKDWRGDLMAPPRGVTEQGAPMGEESLAHYIPRMMSAYFEQVAKSASPISFQGAPNPKTGLTGVERFFGLQPAGMKQAAPERYHAMRQRMEQKQQRATFRHRQRAENPGSAPWPKPQGKYPYKDEQGRTVVGKSHHKNAQGGYDLLYGD